MSISQATKAKIKALTPGEVRASYDAGLAAHAARQLLPSRSEIAAIPGTVIEEGPGRTWTATFAKPDDPARQRRINEAVGEMTAPWRRTEGARGSEQSARIPAARLRDGQGRVRHVPEVHAERIAKRKGLRPVIRWGRPSIRKTFHSNGSVTEERFP